ncbi:MAG: hypothetical protein ACRC3G_08825 [Bacteroidales bacterium]
MKKYSVLFFGGFLCFFGISSSPIEDMLDEFRNKSDFDRISGDWQAIGFDIKRAYESQVEALER